MASLPPAGVSMMTINGEQYMPTPHEVNPEFPDTMTWTQFPPNELWLEDMDWYDALGQDQIKQRRIWAIPSEAGQAEAFEKLLHDFPNRALDMMFCAAVKGKPHMIRFLLGKGVKATANEADGDDMALVPFQAAAANGNLECVKIFVEEARLSVDLSDDIGGTPLMRACSCNHPEIVRYLLEKGADIRIRQSVSVDGIEGEPGVDAFEFAVGSGCLEGARAILNRAEELGQDTATLATPLALAGAAQSKTTELLGLLLKLGRYPTLRSDGQWDGDISLLTDPMKEALEGALEAAVQQGRWESLEPVFAYINSLKSDGTHNWTTLQAKTTAALLEGIISTAGQDSKLNQDAFILLNGTLLDPRSRFTTADIQASKGEVIGDTFFWACRHGSLNMARLIASESPGVDINHLSAKVPPVSTSSLYIAAGNGHSDILAYLFDEHEGEPAIHIGVGLFANGPTALWAAVWNGHADSADILVRHGGPVHDVDDAVKAAENAMRAVVAATKGFRAPVSVVSESAWTRDHGELDSDIVKGTTIHQGDEIHYVVLRLEEGNLRKWDRLEVRKPDAELFSMEKDGRDLKRELK